MSALQDGLGHDLSVTRARVYHQSSLGTLADMSLIRTFAPKNYNG